MCNLKINREGDNLFVDGLPEKQGTTHLVPGLTKGELRVDPKGHAYVSAVVNSTGNGFMASIRRAKDDRTIHMKSFSNNNGTLEFDPWEKVKVIY
jgi:hypothetical protein